MMEGDETREEHMERLLQNPKFAAAWAVEKPFGDLAINVWRVREERGWTQQQLAQRAGIKQPRIAEIERSDANPTLLTISRIAHALGVTPDRLLVNPALHRDGAVGRVATDVAAAEDTPAPAPSAPAAPTPPSAGARKTRGRTRA
jgi:XRE family transcriptional regulator, regulator of sulfur utilization